MDEKEKEFENTPLALPPARHRGRVRLGIIGLIVLGFFALIAFKGYSIASRIIQNGSDMRAPFLTGNVDAQTLRGEGDGRINILLIGIGGAGHPGGQLADTIMVASIDPVNKTLALLSLPRDLYVEIPGNGWAKINHAHAFGQEKNGAGPELLKRTVSRILDLPIHYFIRLDFSGFTKIVDTLGGVTVTLDQPINDPLYPDKKLEGYDPFYLAAGTHLLNGEIALKVARSRQTSSDFARAGRQQVLLTALRDKAFSLKVLANPKKLIDLMEILGDHIRTDLRLRELNRLIELANNFGNSSVITHVFDTSEGGPLTSTVTESGGYIIIPRLGQDKYAELQRTAHEIFTDPYLARERATIEVLNSSQTNGAAVDLGDYLKSYGYNIIGVRRAEERAAKTTIIDYSTGKKSITLKFLAKRLRASVIAGKNAERTADFVIIVGDDYLPGLLIEQDIEQKGDHAQ